MSDSLTKAMASLGHPSLPKAPPPAEQQWPCHPSPIEAALARQGEAQRIRDTAPKPLARFEDFTPVPEPMVVEGPFELED